MREEYANESEYEEECQHEEADQLRHLSISLYKRDKICGSCFRSPLLLKTVLPLPIAYLT